MKNIEYNYYLTKLKVNMISIDELLEMSEDDRAEYLYKEAKKINKRLDPEYEEMIKLSPKYIYWYIIDVIKGRWKEAEKIIIKDPKYIYWYAKNVIKGRWKEAEEIIIKNPKYIYWYAYHIIKNRWLEAELYIKRDNYWWEKYCDWFRIKE